MVTFLEVGGQKITELAADIDLCASRSWSSTPPRRRASGELEAGGSRHLPSRSPGNSPAESGAAGRADRVAHARQAPRRRFSTRRTAWRSRTFSSSTAISGSRPNGVLGSSTRAAAGPAENVDVAQLDRLLLGDQRLAGRLNADATITGALSEPRVEGEFTLTQGAFRTFKFESLAGKVDYAGTGVEPRRPAAADADGLADGQGLCAADAVPSDTGGPGGCPPAGGAWRGRRHSRSSAARSTWA